MTELLDECDRLILPDDAPYLRNLAAAWAHDPSLARRIERVAPDDSVKIEQTRAGVAFPTATVLLPGGRVAPLHSRYQPVDEAKKLVNSVTVADRAVFFVFGFGIGYHVEALFDRIGEESRIYVIEPNLQILRAAMMSRDFQKLIESRRVRFFTKPDKAELFAELTPLTALMSMGFETITLPAAAQIAGDVFAQYKTWLGELESYGRTGMNTLIINGRKTLENIARNIGHYAAAPGIASLAGSCKGKPAIIVSAGPSLRKNKHLLKDAAGRAVIVAVQTTLKPLVDDGIEPDFVTSLDYHEISGRFFENLPPQLRTHLVAEPKATDVIFSLHPGPISLAGNQHAELLLREMSIKKFGLRSGATVAHLSFYLAEHLGCDPIIFVGQDLGFSDGLCYTPGTSYDDVWKPELGAFCTAEMKQWEQIARDRQILRRIPDQQGRPMYTEERLFTYLQQFEKDFAASKSRIIDATEGGALKRGATIMTLADALELYANDDASSRAISAPSESDFTVLPRVLTCLQNRHREAGIIAEISRQTLPLLREIRDHADDQARVNRAIAGIDVLRARVHEADATYELVTQMTQASELARFEADRRIAAEKLSGTDRQKRQVERDIANVEAVERAAGDFQKLMDETIARWSTMLVRSEAA